MRRRCPAAQHQQLATLSPLTISFPHLATQTVEHSAASPSARSIAVPLFGGMVRLWLRASRGVPTRCMFILALIILSSNKWNYLSSTLVELMAVNHGCNEPLALVLRVSDLYHPFPALLFLLDA